MAWRGGGQPLSPARRRVSQAKIKIDNDRMVSIYLPIVMANTSMAFAALGDPTRRALFERLSDGPLAVVEIARGLPVSRPAVSQHLKVLKRARLVRVHRRGRRRLYRVNLEGVQAMRDYLDHFWSTTLEAFKQFAEDEEKTKL